MDYICQFMYVEQFMHVTGFIHFLFKDFYHINNDYCKVFFICFSCVGIFRACCGSFAGSSGGILFWLLLIFFLCWRLCNWGWEDCSSSYQYLVVSSLGKCFVLCSVSFLFLCSGCRKIFRGTDWLGHWGFRLNMLQDFGS